MFSPIGESPAPTQALYYGVRPGRKVMFLTPFPFTWLSIGFLFLSILFPSFLFPRNDVHCVVAPPSSTPYSYTFNV
jgi:hypothetical protein